MKFMLMMNAPRGDGDWNVSKWAPEDLKAHIGFMMRFASDLKKEGSLVAAEGLGTPAQLVELVARGVDMFDCVLPTRIARNGTAFTRKGTISIKGGAAKADFTPIDKDCECYACRNFTKAYLRHLLNVDEILGLRMVSVHNSHFYLEVMREIRASLAAGTFAEYRRQFEATYIPTQKVLASRLERTAVAE